MLKRRPLALTVASLSAAGALATSVVAATLSAEPPPGGLRAGESVLVDDGSCPSGQIKQVTGGGNISLSSGEKRSGGTRTRRCVKRP